MPGWGSRADPPAADRILLRGTGIFSFIHVRDAAGAVDAALRLDSGPELLNIVDDDPAALSEWLPVYAKLLGAEAPGKAPALLARPFAGSYGVAFLTEIRGASNARAKDLLDWRLAYPSWREGFAAELGHSPSDAQKPKGRQSAAAA